MDYFRDCTGAAMKLQDALEKVNAKFEYLADPKLYDFYQVMSEDEEGKLRGDCEDYALTVLWLVNDTSFTKFFINTVLGRHKILRVKTHTGSGHIVAKIGDLWFDNWTKRPLTKKAFFDMTHHTLQFNMPMILTAPFWVTGTLMKVLRK